MVAWAQVFPSTVPPSRAAHRMVYYPTDNTVIMAMGSNNTGTYRADLWAWNGSDWVSLPSGGLPYGGYMGFGMSYHASASKLVVFHGYRGAYDWYTYEYDLVAKTGWSLRSINSPWGSSAWHEQVYVPSTDQSIVVGGYDSTYGIYRNLLAEYKPAYSQWNTQAVNGTPPTARGGVAACFDSNRGVIVLHGGNNSGGTFLDTWEIDVATWTWTQKSAGGPGTPDQREYASMVFDSNRNVCVLYGGRFSSSGPYLDDTWEWDGTSWTQVLTTGPGARNPSMAYDPVGHRIVLFGGHAGGAAFSDTWVLQYDIPAYDVDLNPITVADAEADSFDKDHIWFIEEPQPGGTGLTLDNPSFEIPGEYGAGNDPIVDVPKAWLFDSVAIDFEAATFVGPNRWVEGFEGGWYDNQDFISEFDEGTDLTQGTFGAWPRETTYEGFHQDWGLGNQDAIDEFDMSTLPQGEFNAGGDTADGFEEEWWSRHAIADTASLITETWPTFGNLTETITRLNEIKLVWNTHLGKADVHGGTADTVNLVTAPDATDLASAIALAEHMWNNKVWDHIVDGALAYHREDQKTSIEKWLGDNDLLVIDTQDKAWKVAAFLTALCNMHFTWSSNTGPGFYSAYEDFTLSPTNIYAVPLPAKFDGFDFESDWGNNGWLPSFDPGDITAGLFVVNAGTEDFDSFEAVINMDVKTSVGAGDPFNIDPSHGARVVFSGTFTATLRLEARRNETGQWLNIGEVDNPMPVTVGVDPGYSQLRVYTVTYTSGTPYAQMRWDKLGT